MAMSVNIKTHSGHVCQYKDTFWSCMSILRHILIMSVNIKTHSGHVCQYKDTFWPTSDVTLVAYLLKCL